VKRREFITLLGGAVAAWPLAARAQQASRNLRVGITTIQPRTSPPYAAFDQRLRELGYVDGQNLTIDFLNPDNYAGIDGAMKELARRKVDVIVAPYESTVKSGLTAADSPPMVMIAVDYDPLALGYISSLARPGGRVTGVFLQPIELATKRLQLLKDTLPDLQTAIMFWESSSADQWNAASRAASGLGLRLAGVEFREQPYDYENALARAPLDYRGALIVPHSPVFYRERQRHVDLALRHKMASMFGLREWVDAGGLLSYGASFPDMFRRAADYVDRIAKGAKAADLPVEQPTKFELILNLKTAQAIGVSIPTAILLRADEIIE
jgi:putative ABC transport system substrate-binding protein